MRTDSFFDEMVEYIDVGIVVVAERLSLPMWEEAAEHISNCSVRIVTTRGGGDGGDGVDGLDMSLAAVAVGFSKAIDTVVNCHASNDRCTLVGHTTPIHPSGLSVKGKKWDTHEGCPMLWIRCHHSVRQFPDQRIRSTGKGNEKGKHKGKDKGKAKGKGKHKDQNKGKGKAKGKGKLNDRGGGK